MNDHPEQKCFVCELTDTEAEVIEQDPRRFSTIHLCPSCTDQVETDPVALRLVHNAA